MARIKLNTVRLSFPKLFTPEAFPGTTNERFGARFQIVKGSALEKEINAAIEAEAQAKWGKTWQKTLKSIEGNSNKCCWLDGDNSKYESDEGHMLLSAGRSAKDGRPIVVNRDRSPIAETDGVIYGGCWVNANVDIWAQDGQYTGMRCTLVSVQFVKDGDNFGGAAKGSAEDFDELGEPEEMDDDSAFA